MSSPTSITRVAVWNRIIAGKRRLIAFWSTSAKRQVLTRAKRACGTSCIDVLSSDLKNCGSCGHQCTPNQFCSVGACQCNATPIRCGTTPVCGTWGFESNTTEGWYLVPSDYSRVYASTFG